MCGKKILHQKKKNLMYITQLCKSGEKIQVIAKIVKKP